MIRVIDIDNDFALMYDKSKHQWAVANSINREVYYLSTEKGFTSILKLLYKDPDIFFETLREVTATNDLPESAVDRFPLRNLVIFCLSNELFYWVEQSIPWFKYIKIDDGFVGHIQKVSKDIKVDQKLRHKLIKAVQWGNSGNASK